MGFYCARCLVLNLSVTSSKENLGAERNKTCANKKQS